jgi:3-phenylpropionate/trans-cinnamate dioxygenase ferredoxin subunit
MANDVEWIEIGAVDDIDEEEVIRFDYADRTFAVYRSDKNKFYATDGYCAHEKFHLAEGLVMGNIIECPKHIGRFDYTTGDAKRTPVCVDLKTYPVKVEDDKIFIQND